MPETTIARRLVIRGRVQGVCYRAGAVAEAERLGLTGWVRNRRDGSVEALVSGPPASVDGFVEWARKGPSGARVDRVDVAADEIQGPGPFSVRPTA
jgi:acylphosphatase